MASNSRLTSVVRAVLLGTATAAVVLRLTRMAFLFVNVVGTSMEPTFVPGDRVIAIRRRLARPLRVGDVVVLRGPQPGGHLIKRVAATSGMDVPGQPGQTVPAGSLWVLGDGRKSFDSRQFGAIGDDEAVGLVVRRLWSDPRGG
ncbi:S26 family signal peptidase [Kribbella deserti]|uniref:S26 family signal peptidase n=1 Tax=Kribbella deserti TaxID=1926257 RepID=A0ABV6QNH8_9ACTN